MFREGKEATLGQPDHDLSHSNPLTHQHSAVNFPTFLYLATL